MRTPRLRTPPAARCADRPVAPRTGRHPCTAGTAVSAPGRGTEPFPGGHPVSGQPEKALENH